MQESNAQPKAGKASRIKPQKPRPNFPLFPHASRKWAKVIRGKTHYFGSWDDPHGAETDYLAVADDLHAGRVPRPSDSSGTGPTIRNICNAFMRSKRAVLDAGNLSPRTFVDYDGVCKRLLEEFGTNRIVADLRPDDFERLYSRLIEKHAITSIGASITMTRSVFKYAFESDLIDKPIKYGPTFRSPSKTDIRKAKAKSKHQNGSRAFEAAQIQSMLKKASPQLKAMILLGINGGMGNTDCASLPLSALDLKRGWLDFPRPKTGIERRIPLWPETVEALKKAIAIRKEPANPDNAGVVFLTRLGQRWVRYEVVETTTYGKKEISARQDDAIAKAAANLLRDLGIKRPGLSFYSLRHTFETIAGGARDQVAVDAIMGHIDGSMAATYRQGIEIERLRAVVDHVRQWLFGAAPVMTVKNL